MFKFNFEFRFVKIYKKIYFNIIVCNIENNFQLSFTLRFKGENKKYITNFPENYLIVIIYRIMIKKKVIITLSKNSIALKYNKK